MAFAKKTEDRFDQRVASLIGSFDACLDEYESAGLFSGPSVHFHRKTIARREQLEGVKACAADDRFREYLYATLASWGMHRMGASATKLVGFDEFSASVRDASRTLVALENHVIGTMGAEEATRVAELLWNSVRSLRVGAGNAKLVAGTKTIHHLLPDLLPPMDREYTLRFFFAHKGIQGREAEKFDAMFVAFDDIARKCAKKVKLRLRDRNSHTSRSKVLDNAVVGWILKNRS